MRAMKLLDVLERCRKSAAWDGQQILRLDQRNDLNDTPLHTVCSWGEILPVEILLENGADVRARGDKGGTVLFNAIVGRSPDVVRLLLKKGADPSVKNDWGMTPFEYATNVSAPESILGLLRKKATRG